MGRVPTKRKKDVAFRKEAKRIAKPKRGVKRDEVARVAQEWECASSSYADFATGFRCTFTTIFLGLSNS